MNLQNDYHVSFGRGVSLSLEAAIKAYGLKSTCIAVLHQEAKRRLDQKGPTRGYPPRIFISYRWESEEHRVWVYNLATILERKKYRLFFDQVDLGLENIHFLQIPQFISNIVLSDIFLIVITPGYVQSAGESSDPFYGFKLRTSPEIGSDLHKWLPNIKHGGSLRNLRDGWVLDENQLAVSLANQKFPIQMMGILKEGDQLPNGCNISNVIDVRTCFRNLEDISKLIPEYKGISMSENKLNEFREIIKKSSLLSKMKRYDAALALLDDHPEFRETEEWTKHVVLNCQQLGLIERAMSEANRML